MKKFLCFGLAISMLLGMLKVGSIDVSAAQATGVTNNGVYNLVNANSSKYANVHNGVDADNTNIYQWTNDGSNEQKFKLAYDSSQDAYRIYVMCSSSGTNRVLDIVKSSGSVVSGCNVQIYRPVDNTAQLWTITPLSNGKYAIRPKSNTSVALTAYGTSNGTSSGTTSTSAGNIFVSTLVNSTVATNQQWTLNLVGSSTSSDWNYFFRSPKMASRLSSTHNVDHYGIDVVHSTQGEIVNSYPIYSVASGSVKVSTFSSSAGNYVVITQDDGYTVRYLHMKNTPLVTQNSSVTSSTQLGLVGNTGSVIPMPTNTGDLTSGAHLHFDVNNKGLYYGGSGSGYINYSTTINPVPFFPNVTFTY